MGYSTKSGSAALPLPTLSTAVTELSGALDNISSALGGTDIAQRGGAIDVWIGQAADAYAGEANVVQTRIIEAQGALADAGAALDDYQSAYDTLVGTTIPDYQDQWDEAKRVHDENVQDYESQRTTVIREAERTGSTVDLSEFDRLIQQEHDTLEQNQDDLATYYNESVNGVDDIASEKGGLVAAAIDGLVPRDIATDGGDPFTPNRNNIGVSLFGDLDHVGANARWEDAQEDVEGAIDLFNNEGESGMPTQEALEEFNELYGDRLANDPFFAAAFADRVSPERMFEVSGQQRDFMFGHGPEYQDAYIAFQANLGAALMLASGSEPANGYSIAWRVWDNGNDALIFDDDSVGYEQWQSGYLNDIKEAGEGYYGNMGTAGYFYLSQLLGAAGENYEGLSLSDEFLNEGGTDSVAHEIVRWRHESPFQFDAMTGARPTMSNDPLYNLISVMDGNPEATRTFMASDTGFDYGNDNQNMTAYLVGHRQQMDWYPWPDGGTQLGVIIDEATSTNDAREHPETFEILSGFLDGYNDGLQRDQNPGWLSGEDKTDSFWWFEENEGDGQDFFGRDNHGLRHMAGSILEEYVSDLAREVRMPTGVDGAPPYTQNLDGNGYTLALSPELQNALTDAENGFFFDLSYDTPPHPGDDASESEIEAWAAEVEESALGKISTAAAQEMRIEMTQARVEGNGAMYSDVAGDYGTLLTHMELADYNADVEQGAQTDARNSTVRSAIDFATEFIPWKKIPGFEELPDAVQTAIKQGQSGATEMGYAEFLSTDNEANAQDARGVGLEAIEQQIREAAEAAGIDAHNQAVTDPMSEEELEAIQEQRDSVKEDQIFVRDDGTIVPLNEMTPEERQAYNLWANDFRLGDGEWTGNFNNDIADIVDNAYNDSVNYNP